MWGIHPATQGEKMALNEIHVRIDSVCSFVDPRLDPKAHRMTIRFVERLNTLTTHINPAYSRAAQMGMRADPASERIRLLVSENGRCEVPRGCLTDIQAAAKVTGTRIVWEPEVLSNGVKPRSIAQIERDIWSRTGREFRMRAEYQPDIVTSILKKRQGMVVLPCGGGKTMSGVMAALVSGEATLIMVHTEDLLVQWVDAIRFLSGLDPRVIGAGRHDRRSLDAGEIVVAMVQTLAPNINSYLPVLSSVGFLLVDECHRAPADLFATVINRCQGRYRVGLSATPNRADGFGFLINALIGPTIFRLQGGAMDLIEWGYLRRPLVIPVASPYSPSEMAREWELTCPACEAEPKRAARAPQVLGSLEDRKKFKAGKLSCKRDGRVSVKCGYTFSGKERFSLGKVILAQVQSEAALHPGRVELISTLAQDGAEAGRLILTLTNRKDGVAALEAEQKRRGVAVRGATSETEARGAVIAGFRAGRYRSLIATQLADEGLDVPALDMLIMSSAGRHDGTAQQRLGRICRPAGAQIPVCFDIVDQYAAALSQWRERAAAYVDAYGEQCLPTDRPVPLGVALSALQALARGATLEQVAEILKANQQAPKPATLSGEVKATPPRGRVIRRGFAKSE